MAATKKSSTKRAPKKAKNTSVIPLRGETRPPADDAIENPNGHNSEAASKARAAALKAAHEETYALEKQEEALMAKHIQPLRDQRSEIKAALKKDYEITANQFNAWHGVYYYDREAESGNDWVTMQIIREQAAACPVGGSLDLVDLAEKASKQREEQAAAAAAKKKTVENVEHAL